MIRALLLSGFSPQKILLGGCLLGPGFPTCFTFGVPVLMRAGGEQHPCRVFLLRSHCQRPFLDAVEGTDMQERSRRFAGCGLLQESSLGPTGQQEPVVNPATCPGLRQACSLGPAVWLLQAGSAAFPVDSSAQPGAKGEFALVQV